MTTSEDAFREAVRAFVEANCPAALRTPMIHPEDRAYAGRKSAMNADQRAWLTAMAARGWTAPTWPEVYGGGGLDEGRATILREELARVRARPPLEDYGLTMLGPALLTYGTEAQKQEHLPPIVRGEVRWCQGYSEPGAGSDLASLATAARKDGDVYIVDGTKIWTSHAHHADWIFCLVRTDREAPKHAGISVLLIDLTSPGVSVRPIELISGHGQFCETRFEGVEVPADNLLGPLNGGWEIAKFILVQERQMYGDHARRGVEARSLGEIARDRIGTVEGRLNDPILRTDILRHEMRAKAFEAARERMRHSGGSSALAPFAKLYGTELNKERQDLVMAIHGPDAFGWEGEEFDGGNTVRTWLRSRGNSIEGGTSEIQLNLIAQRVLSLPKGKS